MLSPKDPLRALCRLTGLLAPGQAMPGYNRTRALFGPLRGMLLSMPGIEQPSLSLGLYERHVVRALEASLAPGAVAYDIGAHVGYLSFVMARRVGSEGKVFSFEANPRNVQALRANAEVNGLANVTVVAKAVAAASGIETFATFSYSLVGHIAGPETPADASLLKVPATSIDDFVYGEGNPAPSLIKIDVEGAEDGVFLGAERTLREARPAVIAEVRGGTIWEAISRVTRSCGYEARALKDATTPLPPTSVAEVLFLPRPIAALAT